MRLVLFCICLVSCLQLHSPAAHAQSQEDIEKAAELAGKGVDFYKKEFWVQAVKHFLAAQDLVPDVSNLYNIARCYDNLGMYKLAAEYYQAYIDQGGPNADKANDYLASLKVMPALVTIHSTPSEAMVRIDDNPFFAGSTPLEIELDPGAHKIMVIKDGYELQWRIETFEFATERELTFILNEAKSKEPDPGSTDAAKSKTKKVSDESTAATGEIEEDPWGLQGPGGPYALQHTRDSAVEHFVAAAIGLSFPIRFQEVHSFIGASLSWNFLIKGFGAGLGMDMQFAGDSQMYDFFVYGTYNLEFGPGFSFYTRLGMGPGFLRCRVSDLDVCRKIRPSFVLRMSLGIGWSRSGFDVRLSAANFLMHVWRRYLDGATAQWLPLLWVGYRF